MIYNKTRGFTLVELMIAVTITSIVVLAAYSLMTATTSNFDNEDDRVQLRGNLRSTEMLLQRDIGRTGFRANLLDASGGLFVQASPSTSSDVTFQSLRLAQTTLDGRAFSQLTIVADITDFGAFQIDRSAGPNIMLKASDLQAVQTNDCLMRLTNMQENQYLKSDGVTCSIGYCQNCQNGAAEAGAANRFNEAFEQSFNEASAVRFSVSQNPLKSDIRLMNKAVAPSNRQFALQSSFMWPPDHTYAGQLSKDLVVPITAMTYTVMRDQTSNERVLVRCTHSITQTGQNLNNLVRNSETRPVATPAYSCAVVLRNVDDFQIYPLTNGDTLDNAIANMTDPTRKANLANDPGSVNINNIAALLVHVTTHGTVKLNNPVYDAAENAARYEPPFFAEGGQNGEAPSAIYSSESLQFVAPIQSRIEGTDTDHQLGAGTLILTKAN